MQKLLFISLFLLTAAGVAVYPSVRANLLDTGAQPTAHVTAAHAARIDVVFVLDTTGSMSGLIDAAKEKIWSIARTMSSAQPVPEIRIGLVAYRDRGDQYVTQVHDLTTDIDSVYATLIDFEAGGGGDGPESVNKALFDAVHNVSWSQDQDVYQVVFLVGDAPPHMDYADEVQYPEILKTATERGIVVNTIRCGADASTGREWKLIAAATQGNYFSVDQGGSAIAMTTPFDETLARLSQELDATRLFYGDEEDRVEQARKLAATEKLHAKASTAAKARRAEFNATKSGSANLYGKGDLVADVEAGRVELEEIVVADLPAPMQAMSPEDRKAVLVENKIRRDELKKQIADLGRQRSEYLADALKDEDTATSLDDKLFETVKEQAGEKGLAYKNGPAY
jgi:Mg-chelatase subunit ChlD